MNSFQDQDIEFNKSKNPVVISYDLALDQSMYNVPKKILNDLENEFKVILDPVNCPNTKKFNRNTEIYWGNRIEEEMIDLMPNLKWVHFGSVGINRLNKCTKSDLIITSSKGLVTQPMITHIISLIGIFSRRLDLFFKKHEHPLTRNDYDKVFQSLKNFNELKILILGLGDIASSLIEKLYYLGCKIDSVSRSKKNNKFVKNQFLFSDCFEKLHEYDFVISLLPENKETINLIDFNFLKRLNKNSIFMNVGRGTTLVENDLLCALNKEFFRMAILDVTEYEPLPKDSLVYKHPKIFFTPHIASFSPTYWQLQKDLFTHNLKSYISRNYDSMKNIETI